LCRYWRDTAMNLRVSMGRTTLRRISRKLCTNGWGGGMRGKWGAGVGNEHGGRVGMQLCLCYLWNVCVQAQYTRSPGGSKVKAAPNHVTGKKATLMCIKPHCLHCELSPPGHEHPG
jgi:hypothetical protein